MKLVTGTISIVLIGWLVSGADIFKRGIPAVLCYASLIFAALGAEFVREFMENYREELKIIKSPDTEEAAKKADLARREEEIKEMIVSQGRKIEVMDSRIAEMEQKISNISIIAGIKPQNRLIQK